MSAPAPKATGVLELADLSHRLEEHVLADFLRLGVIVQPAIDRRVDDTLVASTNRPNAFRSPRWAARTVSSIGLSLYVVGLESEIIML